MNTKEITKKIILYLVNKLGKEIEGKKKIMKLMFLIEHYDFSSGKIINADFLGNKFEIYYYGVFSRNVMNILSELILSKEINAGFPLSAGKDNKNILDDELIDVRQKVDAVADSFGTMSGYELEMLTLQMLKIHPSEKTNYIGKTISQINS